MEMTEYAERELRQAGWFDEDSDYAGMVGPAVLKMIEEFAQEGHSGYSSGLAVHLFQRLARYRPLSPLKNPLETGEYHDVSFISGAPPNKILQSTRLSSLFSNDSGKTWHDIDQKPERWRKLLSKLRLPVNPRYVVSFPYMSK